MASGYYIALDRKVAFDTFVSGKAFAREVESITKLCAKLAIPEPHDLLDMTADAASLGVDPGLAAAQRKWFPASEGLDWVATLYEHIDEHPRSLKDRAAVLEELDEFKLVFEGAKRRRARWHFRIDY